MVFIFDGNMACKYVGIFFFSKCDVDSILGIKGVLEVFYKNSGSKLNASKSEIFIAGMKTEMIENIKACIGFIIGTFHVRYLGGTPNY